MIPRHNNPLIIVPQRKIYATRTYSHRTQQKTGQQIFRIGSHIDGIEALKDRIRHILMTERFLYIIYPDWYGIELAKYKGKTFGYFRTTIKQTLEDALLIADDRMNAITINEVSKVDIDAWACWFIVHTDIGDISESIEYRRVA